MFEALSKLAEPPPPKGVSVKDWDKILQKGPNCVKTTAPIEEIRKAAAQLSFESLSSVPSLSSVEGMLQIKAAAAEDAELFETALQLTTDLEGAVRTYESFGGKYKRAFGVPMFNMNQQLSGSPSVAGGMSRRSATPMAAPAPAAPAGVGQAAGNPQYSAPGGTSTPSATA